MVSKEINLITFEKKLTPVELGARYRLKKTVVVGLIIYGFISSAVLGVSFYLQQKLAAIESAVSYEQDRIKSMSRNEGMYMILKQKSEALQGIIAGGIDYVALFNFIKSQESDSVSLSDLTFSESGQTTFQAHLKDSATLDAFLNTLIGEKGKLLRRVELSSVTFSADGSFQITFTLQANG